MDAKNEILDAIEIMLDRALANTTKIYGGLCKGITSKGVAKMLVNGIETNVQYYGDTPTVNKQYRVFIPEGNMSNAFMVTGGGSSTKPSTGGVTSVNGQTGEVNLTASDVGALPDTTVVPDKTSDLTNDSGYITASGAPVQSVNGKTGAVSLGAGDVGALPSTTKIPSTTSDLTNDSGYITEADVPTKTSELNNDSGFITSAALEPYAKSADVPTKVSQLENDSDYATESQVDAKYTKPTAGIPKTDLAAGVQASLDKADTALQSAPVTSVNGKTGAVSLGASDVGAVSTANVTTTLGTSTTKVPSEKAVSDALSSAGQGDMLKSVYDPTGVVQTAGGIPDYVDGKIPTIPTNLVKYQSLTEVEATTPVNADTLQGHTADYFATATSIASIQSTVDGKLDKTGGTMIGALIAQANTNYATAQVRNVIISTADPSGGNNGDIWIKYVE